MSLIASILIDSVAYGMVLFVISIGLSITLGLMGFVNLAHGVFAMAGGYTAAWLMKSFGLGYSLSVVGAVLLVALVAWPLQRLLYSRLQERSDLDQVLFSIGLIFVGIAGMGVVFGNAITPLPLPELLRGSVDVGFRVVPTQRIAAVVVGIAVLVGLVWLLERTRFGIETRAAVEDASAARALGIRTSRVYILGFSLGAGLAALGGVIGAELLPLEPYYPLKYLVVLLAVVAVGGVGSPMGLMASSLLLGTVETAAKYMLPSLSSILFFATMLAVLAWRPAGLFGRTH
ncbi:branched-chain amino acid ABC transporter permease [Variovorax guangxiensis]|uniref:branched-chain amino acid ABC transporter permease n=1 Tax=Variovorax guangxiensis TaxID=1775474 RepID=UPI0028657BDC|nr:branched-chain amino acid ABC transporter permease [Variovorax guangxiensis]MDR6861246.1 branched-chain amino acid transport system permease protein [Variovorax guangxiensis]